MTAQETGIRTLADLPSLDTLDDTYQADPHGANRAALALGPLARMPLGLEVLSYDAVQTVLRDRRFVMPQGLSLSLQGITSGPVWDRVVKGILSLDGDEHHRLRRLVLHAFKPRAAERLREAMVDIIREIVDRVAGRRECDVVTDIARPYPIAVICQLLGTPRKDWEKFSAWTDDIFKIFNFNVAEDSPAILAAFEQSDAYIDAMVEERRRSLTDDLVSDLIRAEEEGDRLSHEEMRMLIGAVLTAGTDTTRNQLAAAVQVFCEHPDQWRLLGAHPELGASAVEEVMRHSPIIFGTMRVAAEDVELCGVTIPAGTIIDVNTSAANRDPSVFPDPDRFDITRRPDSMMLTFGGGIHYCLGVHLAKAELAEALVLMAQRMPNIRQTGPAPWKPVVGISGPLTLPVAWDVL
ncbi:MAG TPA: cytochrome P450 [Mycobacteriales bacterium]|jgi:cytochrome P450|nr:cytochrome P450 [Mycobacteriales bacterium]